MPRIRSLKPDLCSDETLGLLSRDARYLFVCLITISDDYGRFRANPALLRGQIYPYDDVKPTDIAEWLDELVQAGRVLQYEVNGQTYGQLVNWDKHQRVDNAGHSDLPAPPQGAAEGGDGQRTSASRGDSPKAAASLGDSPLDMDTDRDKDKEKVVCDAKAPPPSKPLHPDADRLCELLADLIAAKGSKRPRVTAKWRADCDKAIRLDGRTPEQLENAMRWAQADPFWCSNVMSMGKLRHHFDRLRLEAQRKARAGPDKHLSVVGPVGAPLDPLEAYRQQEGIA